MPRLRPVKDLTYFFATTVINTDHTCILSVCLDAQVLTKTYILQPEDDIVPKEFVGCKINWKEGKDVTVEQVGRFWQPGGGGYQAGGVPHMGWVEGANAR